MRTHTLVFSGLLLISSLSPFASYAKQPISDPNALGSSPQWLTTRVYIEGAPEQDVKASYPGVVGISMWDPQRNRYKFFLHRHRAIKICRRRWRLLLGQRRQEDPCSDT